MTQCARCSARIPGGRTYCHPHYLEALRDYERELEQFQQDMAAWDALPPEEKARRHRSAETDEVGAFAALVGLGLGGMAWYALHQWRPIDGLWGLLVAFAVTCVVANWAPLRLMFGRPARALFVALPALFAAGAALLLLALISSLVAAHWRSLALVLMMAILAVSFIREGRGAHHSTGAPRMPLEPRP